jgi:hypothetical protein
MFQRRNFESMNFNSPFGISNVRALNKLKLLDKRPVYGKDLDEH